MNKTYVYIILYMCHIYSYLLIWTLTFFDAWIWIQIQSWNYLVCQKNVQCLNLNVFVCLHIRHHALFPNSDSLGLLSLKADERRRVYGCRPGRCLSGVWSRVCRWCLWCFGGVSVVCRCVGGMSVVSRWCLGAISVMSWWCLGGVWVVSRWCPWYLGGVLVCLRGVSAVSRRCLGGGLGGVSVVSRGVSVVSRWCLGGVLVVSGWGLGGVSVVLVFRRCVDDVSVVSLVLVVSWWCLSSFHVDSRCSRCLGRILVASCWWCRGGCVGGPLDVPCTR